MMGSDATALWSQYWRSLKLFSVCALGEQLHGTECAAISECEGLWVLLNVGAPVG